MGHVELLPDHRISLGHLPLGEEDAKWVRLVTALVFRFHPLASTAVRHVVRDGRLLENLPDKLRTKPVSFCRITTGVAPPLELTKSDLVLGVMPGIAGEQGERAPDVVESDLHGVALKLIRAHAAVTVTQCQLLFRGESPTNMNIIP